jgi:hypothetical protein
MSFFEDLIEDSAALLAAGLRLYADLLDGPEPCGHEDFCEIEPSRAEGTQHADAPGEVSRGPLAAEPSPGDSTSELLYTAALWIENAIVDTPNREESTTRPLIARLRDRADRFEAAEVSHEDLASHILAVFLDNEEEPDDFTKQLITDVSAVIAKSLISDFRITKK